MSRTLIVGQESKPHAPKNAGITIIMSAPNLNRGLPVSRRGPLNNNLRDKLEVFLELKDYEIMALRGLTRLEKLERILIQLNIS